MWKANGETADVNFTLSVTALGVSGLNAIQRY